MTPTRPKGDDGLETVRAGYQIPGHNWEVAGFVRNPSGQKSFLGAFDLINPFGLVQGIEGNPRTFGGEINDHF
jgi:hypothetical protein